MVVEQHQYTPLHQLDDDILLQHTLILVLQDEAHSVSQKEEVLQWIGAPHVQPQMLQVPSEEQYSSPTIHMENINYLNAANKEETRIMIILK